MLIKKSSHLPEAATASARLHLAHPTTNSTRILLHDAKLLQLEQLHAPCLLGVCFLFTMIKSVWESEYQDGGAAVLRERTPYKSMAST
jgi:hypothetical protein